MFFQPISCFGRGPGDRVVVAWGGHIAAAGWSYHGLPWKQWLILHVLLHVLHAFSFEEASLRRRSDRQTQCTGVEAACLSAHWLSMWINRTVCCMANPNRPKIHKRYFPERKYTQHTVRTFQRAKIHNTLYGTFQRAKIHNTLYVPSR